MRIPNPRANFDHVIAFFQRAPCNAKAIKDLDSTRLQAIGMSGGNPGCIPVDNSTRDLVSACPSSGHQAGWTSTNDEEIHM